MVLWQGPYEVVALCSPPEEITVRLVGTDERKDVSWRKCRRIAGPNLEVTQAVQNSALNDIQKFKVEYFADWGFDDLNEVLLLVHWRNFDESDRT